MVKRYVLGFAINSDLDMVALVQKKKGPERNLHKWNGIGGKTNIGEDVYQAMRREFKEETGHDVPNWRQFGIFISLTWHVDLFVTEFNGELPAVNDADELLAFEEISCVLDPDSKNRYAQNVPVMVAHAALGDGWLSMKVTE